MIKIPHELITKSKSDTREKSVKSNINGKHMKRGMEAYMVLYLALNKICPKKVFENLSCDTQKY